MSVKKEMIGNRFGRLVVLSESKERYSNGLVLWNCICDCGKEVTVNGASLRAGRTKSCGCIQEMPLSKRTFECPDCGLSMDRDFNASINIRNIGLNTLGLKI
jgi:hypothetical protein